MNCLKKYKKLAVVCPAFVADNLETLEEINIRAREQFLENDRIEFTYIPCLNDNNNWVEFLGNYIIQEENRVLTKGDDYPIHQKASPLAEVGSSRNFAIGILTVTQAKMKFSLELSYAFTQI